MHTASLGSSGGRGAVVRKLLPLLALLAVILAAGSRLGGAAPAVGTEVSTTSGVLNSGTITYGQTAGGTVTISGLAPDAGSGYIDPTGSLNVYYCYDAASTPATCDNTNWSSISAFPLLGGAVTDDGIATVSLTGWSPPQGAGYYTIVAAYGGDSVYAASSDSQNLTVDKADITIVATDKNVAYGAASQPAYTYTATGLVGTDTIAVLDTEPTCELPVTTTYDPATAQAGDTFTIECSGASDDNYNITGYTNGTLTVVPAVLSLTIDDVDLDYGDPEPANYTYTLTGFVNGEDETALDVAVDCALDGTYAVTDAAGTTYDIICTFSDSNYVVDPAAVPGTLTVVPAPLTVTADGVTLTYGDPEPNPYAYTVDATGLKNGDTASVVSGVTCDSSYTSTTGVASSPLSITCSGGTASNYDITYAPGELTIDKAPLTVTADDDTVTYGDAEPNPYNYTVDPAGLLNGDTASVVTGVTCDSSYTSTTGVSSSPLTITCTGGTAANYEITHETGDLTIQKKDITITADDVNVEYGDSEPATYTFTADGLVNGDDENDLDTPPTCAIETGSSYSPTDDVDTTYNIDCTGGSDDNYNITGYTPGAFNVDPATLTVTADDFTIDYGDPEPSPYTYQVTGFKNGENEGSATNYSAPTCSAASALETSTITCSGGSAKNYVFDYLDGTLTVNPYELAPAETWYTGQTFYYTKSASDTSVQVTLTASISASFTCSEGGPTVADGVVSFKDKLTGKVYAKNVPIAEVDGNCNEGIATAFATLSSGSYYAQSYVLVVEAGGSLTGSNDGVDSGYQLNADPGSATVVVSTPQPAGTGIFGYGELAFIANSTSTALGTEGTLTSGMSASDSVTFNISLTYTTGKKATTPKGQITLIIPGPNGSFYYVKSNSITSVTSSGGNTATIYAKANITQFNADDTSVSIEGGASLRVDVTETGTLAGFTLQSSKTSALLYSNQWTKSGKAWATVQQLIAGAGAYISVQ